jgi:four helix bundle protein
MSVTAQSERLSSKGPAYQRLTAWHASYALTLEVYRASARWPKVEQYGLTAQVRRSAVSVAANIAEGAAKRGPAEFRRFLDISLGSLSELRYLLELCRDLTILSPEEWGELEAKRDHAARLTWGLCQSIRLRADSRSGKAKV